MSDSQVSEHRSEAPSLSEPEARAPKQPAPRWHFALVLFVVALLPRLYVASELSREPVWDGHYYHFGATRIAEGLGYSEDVVVAGGQLAWKPWCHYPVGYSGFLAFFYLIFGSSAGVAPLVGAVVGSGTAVLAWSLASRFLSESRAKFAGLLAAFHPGLVLYSGLVMTELLAGALLLAAPAVYLGLQKKRGANVAALAAGLTLGLATLVRPQSVLIAPLIGLLARNSPRGKLLAGALSVASCLLVVLPWTIRNCTTMDGCAFVSTNTGWNLAIGSSPRATGRFEPLRAEDGCRVVTGQVQQDRCWADQGRAWIAQDPARWLSLGPEKLSQTFDHQSFAVGYFAQADPLAWPEDRKRRVRALLGGTQYLLLLLAAFGTSRLPNGRRAHMAWGLGLGLCAVLFFDGVMREPMRIWPLAVMLPIMSLIPPWRRWDHGVTRLLALSFATLIVVHFVFFGEDRYQISVTPALCVLAAAAFRFAPTSPRRGQSAV